MYLENANDVFGIIKRAVKEDKCAICSRALLHMKDLKD